MQKDFEEEQEKNRKKEEEVMRIFSYFKWNLLDSCEVLIYGKWIYGTVCHRTPMLHGA